VELRLGSAARRVRITLTGHDPQGRFTAAGVARVRLLSPLFQPQAQPAVGIGESRRLEGPVEVAFGRNFFFDASFVKTLDVNETDVVRSYISCNEVNRAD
jgi:hypothetical protein